MVVFVMELMVYFACDYFEGLQLASIVTGGIETIKDFGKVNLLF